jgi:large subunit ribosomal protein L8e
MLNLILPTKVLKFILGNLSRASGTYSTIIGHSDDGKKTRVRLPSGKRKTIAGGSRAMIGIVGGGGRTEKPILKAGISYHKHKVRRSCWPKIKCVNMNPVDHPHGGGNHTHIGHGSCISRQAVPGQKAGLVAARRSGYLRGTKAKFQDNEKL